MIKICGDMSELSSKNLQIGLLGYCIICLRKVRVKRRKISRRGTSDADDGGGDSTPAEMAPKSLVTRPGFLSTFNQIWGIMQLKLKEKNGDGLSEEIGISLENVLENSPVSNITFSRAPPICQICCDKVLHVESLMKAVRQQVGEISIILEEGRRRQDGGMGNFEKSLQENGLEESVIRATLQFVGIFNSSHCSRVDFKDLRGGEEGNSSGNAVDTPVPSLMQFDKDNCLIKSDDDENECGYWESGDIQYDEDLDYIKSEVKEDEDDDNESEDKMEVDAEEEDKLDTNYKVDNDPLSLSSDNQFGSGEKEATDSGRIPCTCGRTFVSRKSLRGHMRKNKKIHPEYKPLNSSRQMCEFCGERVMSRDVLSHLTDHLNGKAEWVIKCPNEKCRYMFASLNALHSHIRHSYNKECTRVWKKKCGPICEICGVPGTNVLTIKNHVRDKHEHGKEKKWQCPISDCGQRFFIKQSVHYHLHEHRSRKITEQNCDKCGESLKVEEMEEHLKDKHGIEEVIGCKQCELKFSGRDEMIEHLYEHRGTGILCDICGDKQEKFLNKYSDFREHYFMVHKLCPKKYKCREKDCDKWYWRKEDNDDHQMRIHANKRQRGNMDKGKGGKNFECDLCNIKFARGVTLMSHNIRVHGAEPFKCDSCGESFDDKFKFNKHKKEHGGIVFQKEWKCEVEGCGRIFKAKKNWKHHVEIGHGGKRRHICEECGKGFTFAASLRGHRDTVHLGLRPWVCDECGEGFTSGTALKRHKMIHTGERPFACDICGQRFRQREVLRRHKEGHKKKGAEFKPNGPMKQIRKRKAQ